MVMAAKKSSDKNVVSIADAARNLARKRRGRDDPPPHEARGPNKDVPAAQWTPNDVGLPREAECPVQPIGHGAGLYYLIDSAGEFRGEPASFFTHAGIQDVFAATPNYPKWAWPRFGRSKPPLPPPIESFKDDAVRDALFLACTRRGLFSPTDKLRGRGMWLERGGGLVYHAGAELWTCETRDGVARFHVAETGLREGFLYPRMAELPEPWSEPVSEADDPVPGLLRTFAKWNFEGPKLGPENIPVAAVLLLGWIGMAYLGGALEWRPAVLLLGDKGTGKSTLQEGLQALFGEALFHSGDTSAAGVYQKMRNDSRPVAIDELEADADPRKVDAVVRLMRISASGAMASRGGSDHSGVEFTLRSAFLFSAINNPLSMAQDLSRTAILRLRDLDPGQARPDPIDADTCGRMVLARVMANFPKFAETLADYMRALAAGGHDGRGQKTYATLLAAADLLIGADTATAFGIPLSATDQVGDWSVLLAAESLPEIEDAQKQWRACIEYLLGVQVTVWRHGRRTTVGQLMEDLGDGNNPDFLPAQARRDLGDTGLGLCVPGEVAPIELGYVLAIPNNHPMVRDLFKGSTWQHGSWKDALRTAPAGLVLTDKARNRVRVAGQQKRCSLVVLKRFHEAPER